MVWKSYLLVLTTILVLSQGPLAVAQFPTQPIRVYGMFGARTLGQPLTPGRSTFGGGIPIAPNGSPPTYNSTWQLGEAAMSAQATAAVQPAGNGGTTANAAVTPQLVSPNNYYFSAPPISPELAPQPAVEAPPRPAVAFTAVESGASAAVASAARPQPFVFSAGLSALMTRIARSKGILAGQGIDVYMSNHVARMQGVIRLPADAVLLANVLALEPDVQNIDNRLVLEGADVPSSY